MTRGGLLMGWPRFNGPQWRADPIQQPHFLPIPASWWRVETLSGHHRFLSARFFFIAENLGTQESNTPALKSTAFKRVPGRRGVSRAELQESDTLSELIWKFAHS